MAPAYYDLVVRGTEREDSLVIAQFLKGMVSETFSLLNYYKEIPVSYDARLLSLENEMAEFEVHEYQAKVMAIEKKALLRAHPKSPFREDILADVFYVNTARKRAILTGFHYAKIHSDLRRFVRVNLEGRTADVDLHVVDGTVLGGSVRDISLGGVAIECADVTGIEPGAELRLVLKLDVADHSRPLEIAVTCTVVRLIGETSPYICIAEFQSERQSQQSLAYYINQRQVEIIRELKELAA
ncbi:PilZ domain-containing protein [Trichlorobacter ammonificans]|uniref:PilZ domain-containing protein n=1 Tax=Trichlorobacter ammonificans TaxID=2916410 RepID=A0ABM9D8Z9_9BACT|nr:PilZ domain-containing protein [Trichlorobacter ammonificans]CAH2031711.1 PilZ domain-containing protein [Trichlorobacter ammonificans]